MNRRPNGAPYLFAGAAVGLVSAVMATVALMRLVWAVGGLAVSLMRLAYLTIFDRPHRS